MLFELEVGGASGDTSTDYNYFHDYLGEGILGTVQHDSWRKLRCIKRGLDSCCLEWRGDKDLGHMARFPWIVRLIYSQQVI